MHTEHPSFCVRRKYTSFYVQEKYKEPGNEAKV